MAFPSSPSNGDKTTINGKVYIYNSTDDKWVVDAIALNATSDTVTATGNVTGGNLVTAGIVYAPEMANGNSNIRIAANANVTVSSTGNANVFIVTGLGANISGTANITGNANTGNLGTTTLIATTGNITTINSGLIQNGNSNVTIDANANVTVFVNGNATARAVFTSTGANIAGTANITGNLSAGNISGRVAPRVSSTASISSPLAWNSDNYDQYAATAQAGALTINADSGTPVDGQKILFRLKDNGTARALTWTTGATNAFRAVGVTLPTTTTINKTTYVGCIYNSADSRWDAIAVTTEV